MKGYEYTAHTADVGLIAYGDTEAEAFENAALGMFGLICDLSLVNKAETVTIDVESDSDETLLADWLNELLYIYETRNMLFSVFRIGSIGRGGLAGSATGEQLDRGRHVLREDIKAATYHMLQVEHGEGGWKAQVLFDV